MSNGRQLGRIQVPRKPESRKTVEGIFGFKDAAVFLAHLLF